MSKMLPVSVLFIAILIVSTGAVIYVARQINVNLVSNGSIIELYDDGDVVVTELSLAALNIGQSESLYFKLENLDVVAISIALNVTFPEGWAMADSNFGYRLEAAPEWSSGSFLEWILIPVAGRLEVGINFLNVDAVAGSYVAEMNVTVNG